MVFAVAATDVYSVVATSDLAKQLWLGSVAFGSSLAVVVGARHFPGDCLAFAGGASCD